MNAPRFCLDCGRQLRGRHSRRCRGCHGRSTGNLARGNADRPAGHPSRYAAARKRWDKALAWCPIEYREVYFRFRVSKRFLAAEARRLTEEMIAEDLARYRRTGRLQQAARLRRERGGREMCA